MVTIHHRFCGPSGSANGGYACGVGASLLADGGAGPVEVTLRSPPPLDAGLEVERTDGRAILKHDGRLVAEAVRAPLNLEAPSPVSYGDAVQAARAYPWTEGHPYPRCFVCGPQRAEGDGLRIFPGAVRGRSVAAAPWTPSASVGDSDGRVSQPIVWAALDCPSWFGVSCFHTWEGRPLLGRLAVEILERPAVGARCVCVGWLVRRDGRKHHAGSALFAEDGALLAVGRATWLTVP